MKFPPDPAARKAIEDYEAQRGLVDFPQLHGQDLDFRGADLSGICEIANLAGANLEGVPMRGTSFVGAILFFMHAPRADFTNADLVKADIDGSNLENACLVNIQGQRASWASIKAQGADFTGATLYDAFFHNADLRDVSFRDADLFRISWDGARLAGARFDGATGAVDVDDPVDVGTDESHFIQGDELLAWLHAQGGTELTAWTPPAEHNDVRIFTKSMQRSEGSLLQTLRRWWQRKR